MIKVAVLSGVGDIADVLNDNDVTGGEIRYFAFAFDQSIKNRLVRNIKKLIMFIGYIRKYDVLLIAYISRWDYIYAGIAKAFRVPTIAHWVGCDVRHLLHSGRKYRGLNAYVAHLAVSPLLQEELATKGISAKLLWIAPQKISFDIAKMPEKHAVFTYLPQGQEAFYGYEIIKQVIDRYPQVEFYIAANDDKELFPQANAKLTGWLSRKDMDEMYDKISIIIRCPQHDGWSRILMEGHFKGKEIIFSVFDGPHMRKATTLDELCREMDDILSRPPTPNRDAHEYAIENFMPQTYAEKMAEEIRKVTKAHGL